MNVAKVMERTRQRPLRNGAALFFVLLVFFSCQQKANDTTMQLLGLILPVAGTTGSSGGTGTGSPPPATGIVTASVQVGSLLWQRCVIGQGWNATGSNCRGTGSAANEYGAQLLSYCSSDNNNCNGGTDTGTLATPTGGSQSDALAACAALSTSGHTDWRLPTKNELKSLVVCSSGPATPLADYAFCTGSPSTPTLDTATFADSPVSEYWSSTSSSALAAWSVNLEYGYSDDSAYKSFEKYVRCVTAP